MIFSARISQVGSMHVANLLLLKDFTAPLQERAKTAFRSFDEALLKVRSDTDATKIYSPDDRGDQRLMELNTATQATLRSIQRGSKLTGEFYTLGLDRELGHAPNAAPVHAIWSNFPAWTRCFVESVDGELTEIRAPRGPDSAAWAKWDPHVDDLYLHVSFFGQEPNLLGHTIDRNQHPFFTGRMGQLVDAPSAFPTLSLRLKSEDW